jgi:ribose 5-phosphate isomerase RpiB
MNIICIGGRADGPQTFLASEFSQAPRHLRRLSKVASLELQSTMANR